MQGLGLRILGVGFRTLGLGLRVLGLGAKCPSKDTVQWGPQESP